MPKKKLTPEQLTRRAQAAFTRRIRDTFTNFGFVYLPTSGRERVFGNKTGELDQAFLFENLLILCEDTTEASPRSHLMNKKVLFDEIDKNRQDLLAWLRALHPEKFEAFAEYDVQRYKIFYLYFSKNDFPVTANDRELFAPVKVARPASLNYLHQISQTIRRSGISEMFRFLGVSSIELGLASSSQQAKTIPTTIIYPDGNTGLQNGVRIVSFMMSADTLLRNSYVLRKDNWEDSAALYQRLVDRKRIQKIRSYIASSKSAFINNIIVSLPNGVEFRNSQGAVVQLKDISSWAAHTMHIPDELNSICIIDGQHRVFAHYHGNDSLEPTIAKLREKFHLLVTGLVFPPEMGSHQRRKIESDVFLDINSTARPVPPDVLLFISTLRDPYSAFGIARQVLQKLNESSVFLNVFQLSSMDEGKLKIASIIKFALGYLVDITDSSDRPSLFATWATSEKRASLINERVDTGSTGQLLDEYIEYCAKTLRAYFSALKSLHKEEWGGAQSRILSTTSINGHLIALRRSLPKYGALDFQKYRMRLTKLNVSYDLAHFPYASSQYAKFSRQILEECFGINAE